MAGIHGAGAALYARNYHGAVLGEGLGRTGRAYGIPTKDHNLNTLSFDSIRYHVDQFLLYAHRNSELKFNITRVGCGLAGYKDDDIGPLFSKAPGNCVLPLSWLKYLDE